MSGWFTLLQIVNSFVIEFVLLRAGWSGFAASLLITLATFVIDWASSDALSINLKRLHSHGFSTAVILSFASYNAVVGLLGNMAIMTLFCSDAAMFGDDFFTWRLWLQVLFNLLLAEGLFTFSHRQLHCSPSLCKLHEFHHCCIRSSVTTNVLFDPRDMALEFTLPGLAVMAMHMWGWQNPVSLGWTNFIMTIWYGLDHDEWLRLPHVLHHSYCNSNYAIYSTFKGDASHNVLRRKMLTAN